jgi:hypothetical protein
MKSRWYCIVVGGAAFWFPAIVFVAIFHEDTSILWLNVIPLLGLIALALIDWISLKRVLRWNWVLAGVYILGPISMLTIAAFSGGQPPSMSRPRDLLIAILICLFPPFTIWLSLLNLMIFSVLAASITLPIFAIFERGRGIRSLL